VLATLQRMARIGGALVVVGAVGRGKRAAIAIIATILSAQRVVITCYRCMIALPCCNVDGHTSVCGAGTVVSAGARGVRAASGV
jgi:hypothetical protein